VRESFPALYRWLPWADHLPTVDETREHLMQAQARFRSGEDCGLLLWDRLNGGLIGASGLHPRLTDPTRREIGYWIRTSAAGRGLATEAVRAIAHCALHELGFTGVEIHCVARNVASERVAIGAGFTRVGVRTNHGTDREGSEPPTTLIYVLEAERGGTRGA
jgi:RimJ/RimL family protein N-acetyltransferase